MAIMVVGAVCFGITVGYIYHMRSKYEALGYYSALKEDGTEEFVKKKSKWE